VRKEYSLVKASNYGREAASLVKQGASVYVGGSSAQGSFQLIRQATSRNNIGYKEVPLPLHLIKKQIAKFMDNLSRKEGLEVEFDRSRANGTIVFKPELSDFKPIKSTDSSLNPG